MRRIVPAICIIALIFLFASCSNDKSRETANHPDDNGTTVNVNENSANSPDPSGSNDDPSTSVGESDTVAQGTANDINAASTGGPDIPQIYTDYMKRLDPDNEDDICFFAIEDMNLDGENEIIIATGTSGDDQYTNYVSHLYILSDKNGVVGHLGDDLCNEGYMVYQVKLIRMQDDPKNYLYCGLTNGANLTGFKVVGLADDDTPYGLCYSASATGAGEDRLMDSNNDGQYDGYTQYRWSYDVLYYPLIRTYIYENNTFRLADTIVDLPDYPTEVRDVILQYLALNAIDALESDEVAERLADLCSDKDAGRINFAEDDIYGPVFNTLMELPDGIEFNIDEQGNVARAIISFHDDYGTLKGYRFELEKTDSRWTITTITDTANQ